jgi:ribosomal protein S18 acetylase RimI-like enzyme
MLDKEAITTLKGLEVSALDESEVGEALDVVARGMRDNSLHLVAYGEDPERRLRKIHRFVSAAFAVKDFSSHTLVARRADGAILGVCGMLPPGDCLPTLGDKLRMMPRLLPNGPRAVGRMMRWLGVWDKHHPKERHWHLRPVAVDAHLQGIGVGSKLMLGFCEKMDAAGEVAYLETDKEINVRFYERFSFKVISEEEVLGAPNWFMLRRPEKRS